MPDYFDLKNRVALVTGASRGLGLAMAEALAEVGATVILNGRDANTLKVAADRMRDRGLKAETSAFDVTDLRAADAAIQSIVADHHRLGILIANAGTIHRAPLADWTSEAWDEVLATNLPRQPNAALLQVQAAPSLTAHPVKVIRSLPVPWRHLFGAV
jgi:gluconate 5-dehydrogenase